LTNSEVASTKVLTKLEFFKVQEALAEFCILPGGKEEALALSPVADLRAIKLWLRETEEAVQLLRLNPLFSLRGAGEIRPALERCERGGILSIMDLLVLKDTMKVWRRTAQSLADMKDDMVEELYALRGIASGFIAQRGLEDEISRAVGEDGELKDDASAELARLRRTKQTLKQRIKETLANLLRQPETLKMLQDNLVTQRGDRHVLPVKSEYVSVFPGIVHDQSASGSTMYMEPTTVVRLDNELRETGMKEKKEIERILERLTALVAAVLPELSSSYAALLKLDFILGKAAYSKSTGSSSPLPLAKPQIDLRRARHPLLSGNPVPLSLSLDQKRRFLIVTGPNTGGKTVALKTVALMSVMMQAGLQIPAEPESKLGVFSRILLDIGDEQSMEQSLSTFSGHMANIITILAEADANSLVLFDEIGAGTDPTEGVALAAAILGNLLSRGSLGIATTHYGTLKEFAYNTEGVENASVEFDAETLRPTYRMLIGIPGRSNAFNIAESLGLGADVLSAARAFLTQRQQQETDLLANLEETKRQMEQEQSRIEGEQRAATEHAQALEKKATTMAQKQEEILQKAREQAAEIVREAKQETEAAIKEIKEARRLERREQENALAQSRAKLKRYTQKLDEQENAKGQGPKPQQVWAGQTVYLPKLRQKGQVIGKTDTEVVIQANMLKLTVPYHEIRLADDKHTPEHFRRTLAGGMSVGMEKAVTLRSEIDLRGQMAEEALSNLDKYIDDAVLTGIHQVGAIHGKGTGALRTAVHSYLRRHPHVASYRLGEFGEGDSGVTIIELR
jgi:DNA mismatch repair protein MutS2